MRCLAISYSGNPDDDDLDLFFERYKSHAELRDFTTDKSVLALVTKIDGHAKIFLDSVADSDKDTVDKVHELLKENFEGPLTHTHQIFCVGANKSENPTPSKCLFSLEDFCHPCALLCSQKNQKLSEMH